MIQEFLMDHIFSVSILLVGFISLCFQGMMTISLKGYVKASANMKTTKKKVLLNLKNQFETIYGMDHQVRNIEAYVDKYLLKLRFVGLPFSFWEKAPFLSVGVVSLLSVGEAFYGYLNKVSASAFVEIGFSYGIVLTCFFLFFHIFGIKSKKQQIQIQLVDYLENYLTNRLMKSREEPREWKVLDMEMEEAFMEGASPAKEIKDVILQEEQIEEQERLQEEELVQKEIAADSEEITEEPAELSDLELLEEFVQSFLA